jgi:pimeloyl-ACP methyl ester carboxylesterase
VLLCFCAAQGTLGLPLNFIHQWLGRLPTSLVYIKDFRNLCGGCGFPSLGSDRTLAVAAFRYIARRLGGKKVYALGVSSGGYAAVYYGLELQAISILSFSGAVDYTPEFVNSLGPPSKDYLNLCRYAPDYLTNLRDACASAAYKSRILIAYGAGQPRDRRQAERLARLPNVELVGVDYAQHNVVDPLIRERKFMPLLHRFFAGESELSITD